MPEKVNFLASLAFSAENGPRPTEQGGQLEGERVRRLRTAHVGAPRVALARTAPQRARGGKFRQVFLLHDGQFEDIVRAHDQGRFDRRRTIIGRPLPDV